MSSEPSLFLLNFVNEVPHHLIDEEAGAEHLDFLMRHFNDGIFLAAGAKVPRTGGIIIARGTRSKIDQIVGEAPFAHRGLARVEVTEFLAALAAPELKAWLKRD